MKPFLRQLFLFLAFTLALNFVFNVLFSQKGNKVFDQKADYIRENGKSAYRVFFFGSSHIFRHIVPSEFDSICKSLTGLKSFNFGAPATFPPESVFLCENYFANEPVAGKDTPRKYVFLELLPMARVADENIFAAQNYYWMNMDYASLNLNYFLEKDAGLKMKCQDGSKVIFSYLLRKFGFNYLSGVKKEQEHPEWLGVFKNGYYPLEQSEKDFIRKGESQNEITTVREKFLKDTSALNELRSKVELMFRKGVYKLENYDVDYSRKLIQLSDDLEKKNIFLIFLITPRLSLKDYEEVLGLKQALPKNRLIDVGNPDIYPELWSVSNSFDKGHLNANGARLFTQILAQRMDSLLNQK